MERLRVAIDCRISDPRQGIGTALLALAKALAEAEDAGQDYTFIVSTEVANWLAPHNLDPCRVKVITPSGLNGLKKSLRAIAPLRAIWSKVPGKPLTVPLSDGSIESEAFDLVHFPTQDAYLTAVPSIYQPHDLQHLHYPEFFSRVDYALREKRYRAFCAQAAFVCVQTEWTRQDVIKQYGLPPENVVVIPWGVALDSRQAISDQELQTTISKYALPENFFFYPAVTWPHKNHEVIFRALHLLKTDRKRIVHVYFTGARTEFREELDRLASGLGITEQLHYLGFVDPIELRALYRAATAVVFPSKFEGFGLPIVEAFHAGVPVLCSNATVLPEVAGDAALYFPPEASAELATLMSRILDEPQTRKQLSEKGTRRLSWFSFQETAGRFQRLYAAAARRKTLTQRGIMDGLP